MIALELSTANLQTGRLCTKSRTRHPTFPQCLFIWQLVSCLSSCKPRALEMSYNVLSKNKNWPSIVFRRGRTWVSSHWSRELEVSGILELTLFGMTDYNDVCKCRNFPALLYNLHSVNNVLERRFNKFVCIFMQMHDRLANEPGTR